MGETGEPDAPMRPFLDKAPFLLARVDQICTALHAPLAGGETLAQAEFLLVLERMESPSQIALARATGVDRSTTSHIIDNLEAAQMVERAPDADDRRRSRLALAARGRARLPEVGRAFAALQEQLQAPLAPDARAELRRLLRLMTDGNGSAPPWEPGPEAAFLAEAPSLLARRALQVSESHLLASTRRFGLTARQFSLLHLLSHLEGLTQIGFARLFGLDPATCGLIMRNLLARGLLDARVAAEDRRKRLYRITDEGRAVLAAAQPLVDAAERRVMAKLDPAEGAFLVSRLRTVIAAHNHRLRFPGLVDFGSSDHP